MKKPLWSCCLVVPAALTLSRPQRSMLLPPVKGLQGKCAAAAAAVEGPEQKPQMQRERMNIVQPFAALATFLAVLGANMSQQAAVISVDLLAATLVWSLETTGVLQMPPPPRGGWELG